MEQRVKRLSVPQSRQWLISAQDINNWLTMAPKRSDEHSLAVLVIDVSPVAWGERELKRAASDKARLATGKRSVGPATLEELLSAVQAFASAFLSLERDCVLLVVAVAGNEVATVYPRKDQLETYFSNPGSKLDTRQIQKDLVLGVAELVALAAQNTNDASAPLSSSQAAMASGFSMALCLINRFLVSANAGVSALQSNNTWNRANTDDEGVISAIGGGSKKKSNKKVNRAWSPRVFLIQASDDRTGDYNAIMNCSFAAVKHQIVVDGCFIPTIGGGKTSAFLEQTCDLTGGVFLAPSGAAQANKALSEVMLSVFLAPRSARVALNLPAINKVDFRARSFDTGEFLDMAFVCNQCLSIFEKIPQGHCPTCDAEIRSRKRQAN
jgi:transcription initiation factor TFIIH subunit 3